MSSEGIWQHRGTLTLFFGSTADLPTRPDVAGPRRASGKKSTEASGRIGWRDQWRRHFFSPRPSVNVSGQLLFRSGADGPDRNHFETNGCPLIDYFMSGLHPAPSLFSVQRQMPLKGMNLLRQYESFSQYLLTRKSNLEYVDFLRLVKTSHKMYGKYNDKYQF